MLAFHRLRSAPGSSSSSMRYLSLGGTAAIARHTSKPALKVERSSGRSSGSTLIRSAAASTRSSTWGWEVDGCEDFGMQVWGGAATFAGRAVLVIWMLLRCCARAPFAASAYTAPRVATLRRGAAAAQRRRTRAQHDQRNELSRHYGIPGHPTGLHTPL